MAKTTRLPTAGKGEAPAPEPRTALPAIHAHATGAVTLVTSARSLAVSQHNSFEAIGCPPDHLRGLLCELEVPCFEYQRGFVVALLSDIEAALARRGRALPKRLRAVQAEADQDDEASALAAAGLRPRKAGGAR
jgi:hypothetical protein